ncbi:hypothetical protein, variant 2 [Aphanomyces invadans]|uniref:Uncharacterized protein n=1 Tax=Aphanomyces invadans TaxID=157072 RepID=A0A024TSE6_9STRA|nr:hypothetical protein H310_10271 [Aphanomyces invadans]XP_008874825.1 hypothetical protein, variant 1 [Aphanomyces invadans]XP_008874826.1 hypothetical protein, variant 2 [Aphanomyces invadans]ETV96561.1 hypothetical protein H310_10271 [Aphanomyces invadans]ETV96562.1 hypothetical protein, variant 1 [Aphanomyces invadans]ETV96563.1 hypothetical protein, variant 2 [Aphanomyces invadans]|eukprot:XP_008874824.1 hypothetical protein H310_10271 [Aphanomyces invadans]
MRWIQREYYDSLSCQGCIYFIMVYGVVVAIYNAHGINPRVESDDFGLVDTEHCAAVLPIDRPCVHLHVAVVFVLRQEGDFLMLTLAPVRPMTGLATYPPLKVAMSAASKVDRSKYGLSGASWDKMGKIALDEGSTVQRGSNTRTDGWSITSMTWTVRAKGDGVM